MKAKIVSGNAPGGKRTPLAEVLPLDTPLVVQYFPIYACNFTCEYCYFAVPKDKRAFVSDWPIMKYDLYKRSIDEFTQFKDKLKTLRFVGMGEPLLHKDIAKMVDYAVSKNVAERVEILTNGSLLTREMSDDLIDAGLSRLVISLQGLTAEKYHEISNSKIDFDEFVSNIGYFYERKKDTHLYIKIVDYALDSKNGEQQFYDIFGEICDSMAIENVVPIMPFLDYENVLPKKDEAKTQYGFSVPDVEVCPQAFFTMQINPDGKVVPCYQINYPGFMGDLNHQTVQEVWNGEGYRNFRLSMLEGREQVNKVCRDCNFIKYRMFPEDDLSGVADRLKGVYQ